MLLKLFTLPSRMKCLGYLRSGLGCLALGFLSTTAAAQIGVSTFPDRIVLTPDQVSGVDRGFDVIDGVERPIVDTGLSPIASPGLNDGSFSAQGLATSQDASSSFSLSGDVSYESLFSRYKLSGGLQNVDTSNAAQIGLTFVYKKTLQEQYIVNPSQAVTAAMINEARTDPRGFRKLYGTHFVYAVTQGAELDINLSASSLTSAEQASSWLNISASSGGFGADFSLATAQQLLSTMKSFDVSGTFTGQYVPLTGLPTSGLLSDWQKFASTTADAFFAKSGTSAPVQYLACSWTSLNPQLAQYLSAAPDYVFPTAADQLGQVYEGLEILSGRILRVLNDPGLLAAYSAKQQADLLAGEAAVNAQLVIAKADYATLAKNPSASIDFSKFPFISIDWPVCTVVAPPALIGFTNPTFGDDYWIYGQNWKIESAGVDFIEVLPDPSVAGASSIDGESYALKPLNQLKINGPWENAPGSVEPNAPGMIYRRTGTNEITIQSVDFATTATWSGASLYPRNYFINLYRNTTSGPILVSHQALYVPSQ